MNFFNMGIPLGRLFGVRILIHWLFVFYVASELLGSKHIAIDVIYLVVLFGTVLVHEFGHALTCKAVGGEAYQILLWPLGGLAFVQPPPRPWPSLWTTIGGPATHLVMGPLFFVLAQYVVPHMAMSPWRTYLWVASFYGVQINIVLLAFNLIPSYPMDGGRILQEVVWLVAGYRRSLQVAGMVGTVAGMGFVVLGFGATSIAIPWLEYDPAAGVVAGKFTLGGEPWPMLIVIGVLCAMESFRIYKRSQEISAWQKG